jgi:outer membrane lipoprotein LolB
MIVRVLVLLLVLLATGCATQRGVGPSPAAGEGGVPAQAVAPPPDSPEAFAALAARDAQLRDAPGWALAGRLAVARGNDGGTLNVQWVQTGAAFDIRLSAPVTGKQWRLSGGAEGAILEGLEGGLREGPDPEALLLEATGWRLPIRQMPDWVRGLRGPGPVAGLLVDAEGRPVAFQQDAWTLSFRDWWPGDPPLPRRVFAEAEGASVRLVVSEWKARPE